MCGIFGIVNLAGTQPFDRASFDAALDTIVHRGPDGRHVEMPDERVILGHRRLAIIDLTDDSRQPMQRSGRYWLTYNGEIFNYVELRQTLEAAGVRFATSGDVEVLLAAYEHWGASCVTRFNGMWAFAIWDAERGTLFASRDRFGEKPFSYAVHDGQFLFASEIKAIVTYQPALIEPDYNVISNFCRTSVGAQHAETWFRRVRRLPPGCNLFVEDGAVRIERYWSYPERPEVGLSFDAAREQYRALFDDAVRLRMRADVPLGLTLSAGLDSNSIAYVMRGHDAGSHYAFTASFKPDERPQRDASIYADARETTDEADSARVVAEELGYTSVVVQTDYGNFVEELQKIIWHLDSGNSAPAVVPLMQLMREIRKRLKVVMEGQGADELLAGYVSALVWSHAIDHLRSGGVRDALATLRNFGEDYKLSHALLMMARGASNRLPILARIHQWWQGIDRAFGPKLRNFQHMPDYPPVAETGEASGVRRVLRRQHAGGLVNLLHYGDAISMANSVESRMPFLDYRLVEFVSPLPADFLIKLGLGKHIHREAMRGIVPGWIIDNPIKYGFCTPVNEQFRKPAGTPGDPVAVLLSERCLARGLFDEAGLRHLIAQHRAGKADHGPLLFRMLSVELWFRAFVDPREGGSATAVAANPERAVDPVPAVIAGNA